MNFTEIQRTIKLIDLLIAKTMKLEGVQYQEDITDREVRDCMFAQGYLKRAVSGCESVAVASYCIDVAMAVLEGIKLK